MPYPIDDSSNIISSHLSGDYLPFVRGASFKQQTADDFAKQMTSWHYIKYYGGVCDGQEFYDGVTTSGSPTLTSATANFTTADVGKAVMVNEQRGTIIARVSATQVTLSFNVSANRTAERFKYGTDNTAAFQNATNAAEAAGGGTVFAPPGEKGKTYMVAGLIITSDRNGKNPRAQIIIHSKQLPRNGGPDEAPPVIRYLGGTPPMMSDSSFQETRSKYWRSGTIIESLLTYDEVTTAHTDGSLPAVFGTIGYAEGSYNFNGVDVIMENWHIRTHHHRVHGAYLSGAVYKDAQDSIFKYCKADIDESAYSCKEPTYKCVGLMGVQSNAGTVNEYHTCTVVGYRYGLSLGEHALVVNPLIISCVGGIDIQKNGHGVTIISYVSHWNQYSLTFNQFDYSYPSGHAYVMCYRMTIENLNLSDPDPHWNNNIADILDAGIGKGNVVFNKTVSGGGEYYTLTGTGSSKIHYSHVRDPLSTVNAPEYANDAAAAADADLQSGWPYTVAGSTVLHRKP